ncbi:MAG: dihydrofolate reductase family protein [Corynebacterium sp.]|uniref:dihydrofolate reductase family protein n=1 Tax=unclassified Corynebacterium TaxID=2624378 RepID=UPI0026501B80|nr:dihydrofolate reductase family protein [Corynebacterium sp.]MDN6325992.1 dihydrofolate reductase family protein [Corynebacterium sp.]MDN6509574.1 dihydrofolate reductase family protein [Corynebacterium sp.]
MRPLRYAINVTLDGCCHHEAGTPPDEETMAFWARETARADAMLLGRTTYRMMEDAWRRPPDGTWPQWMDTWEIPFAEAIDQARKHVVSATLDHVDWNAELLHGDPVAAVRRLKEQPGDGILLSGVTLPTALVAAGLVDEYVFVVQPVLAGHGPRLLDGLPGHLRLTPVAREEFASGAVAAHYRPA